MKVLASLALTAVCLMASPALAGPAGTGLTFTEEVAKKRAAARVQSASTACVAPKAEQASTSKDAAPAPCRAS